MLLPVHSSWSSKSSRRCWKKTWSSWITASWMPCCSAGVAPRHEPSIMFDSACHDEEDLEWSVFTFWTCFSFSHAPPGTAHLHQGSAGTCVLPRWAWAAQWVPVTRDIVVIIALFDSSGPRNSWEGKINSDICTYCQAREPLLTNWSYLSVRRRANASAATHNKKQTPAVHSAGFGNAGCSPMWFEILSEIWI